jgi:hypothetical protein
MVRAPRIRARWSPQPVRPPTAHPLRVRVRVRLRLRVNEG